MSALNTFGFANFRPGQEAAILRILAGKNYLSPTHTCILITHTQQSFLSIAYLLLFLSLLSRCIHSVDPAYRIRQIIVLSAASLSVLPPVSLPHCGGVSSHITDGGSGNTIFMLIVSMFGKCSQEIQHV